MKGTVYCVGVGPGDPELLTLKARRLIRETRIVALPGEAPRETVAYRIAVQAVPELAEKELVALPMPMLRDRALLAREHRRGAERLEAIADTGENVVFLTLGDPTVYCTFSYLQRLLEADGCPVELVSGVPSFCAAAARLGIPLGEWDQEIHILPAVHRAEDIPALKGTLVLMKSAGRMREVKALLRAGEREVRAVLNCGMENETVCSSLEEIPEDAGYFSLIIAREPEGGSGNAR